MKKKITIKVGLVLAFSLNNHCSRCIKTYHLKYSTSKNIFTNIKNNKTQRESTPPIRLQKEQLINMPHEKGCK